MRLSFNRIVELRKFITYDQMYYCQYRLGVPNDDVSTLKSLSICTLFISGGVTVYQIQRVYNFPSIIITIGEEVKSKDKKGN